MKLRLVLVAMTFLVSFGVSFDSTSAQDDLQATIEALETRVAELESTIEAGATSTAIPYDGGESTLFGDTSSLPSGEAGQVSIVEIGTTRESISWVPVIVQNTLDTPVTQIEISGEATTNGDLVGAGFMIESVAPVVLPPGAYGIANISFGEAEITSETELTFDIDYEESDEPYGLHDLVVDEAEWANDVIIGQVSNPHDFEIENNPQIMFACFADGVLTGIDFTYGVKGNLDPGESSAFQIDYFQWPCESFLVASVGFGDF